MSVSKLGRCDDWLWLVEERGDLRIIPMFLAWIIKDKVIWITQWTQEVTLGRWENSGSPFLNLGNLEDLSNVHAVICHRHFNMGYWLHVRKRKAGDTDLRVIRLYGGPKYESGYVPRKQSKGNEPRWTPILNTWIPLHCSQEPGHALPSWLFVADHLHFQQEIVLQVIVLVCSKNRKIVNFLGLWVCQWLL